jgi:hypothetical protein
MGPLILKDLLVVGASGGEARHDQACCRMLGFDNPPGRSRARPMIRARAQAVVKRVPQNGSRSGKPPGRPKTDAKVIAAVRASLAAGVSIRKAAKLHGVGVSTVQRIKASAG